MVPPVPRPGQLVCLVGNYIEPELAIVIGRRASKSSIDEALGHVFGYVQVIDVSARGLPGVFFLEKSWHTFGPMGPALVTADEMARYIPELLAEVTNILTLEPGDVVATGTHHHALSPVQNGDSITLDVEKLGPALTIIVKDEVGRTWER